MVFVPTPNPPEIPDIATSRCGTHRSSMRTNLLIHRSGLAETNKVTFTNPPPSKVFGVPKQADPEGARDLTMLWKEHAANPHDVPGPDFIKMNKLAAVVGLTTAPEQHSFRQQHTICLKKGEAVRKGRPLLPSDVDPAFVYGMPGSHKTAEEIRLGGMADPPTKLLIQGQFMHNWIKMNEARAKSFDQRSNCIPPQPTAATTGHREGTQQYLAEGKASKDAKEMFKLTKFKKVNGRVLKDAASATAQAHAEPASAACVAE